MGAISDEVREKDRIDEQKVIEARIREREVRYGMGRPSAEEFF